MSVKMNWINCKIYIMTNAEKLKKIIASYSTVADYLQIKLNRVIKNNYVYEGHRMGLAEDIFYAWEEKIDYDHIQSEIFATLKTGMAILAIYNIIPDEEYV
jgi:hypothetical protein